MKTKKRRFEHFEFYDYAGIERHLEKMAGKGWQLSKITRLYWEYRRTEPQKLAYAVTYFPEASDFNPYPTENQLTFHDYCKEAGWQRAAEWAQMQIFCSAAENPTPIESEEPVKLKAIHRSMLKNFLPASALFLLFLLLEIYLQLRAIANAPVSALSNVWFLLTTALFILLAVSMLVSFIGYAVWYFRSKKAVRTGGRCAKIGSGYLKASVVLFIIIIALTVLFTLIEPNGWLAIAGIAAYSAMVALVFVIRNTLKRRAVSRNVNIGVTILSVVVLSFILTGIMTRVADRGMRSGSGHSPAETYTTTISNVKHTWEYYRDPLPLTLEDLQAAADDAHYSYEWTANETFLLAHYSGRQESMPGYARTLFYSIVVVKWPALFDLCLNEYLNMYTILYSYAQIAPDLDNKHFLKTDAPAWQADAVYQLYYGNEAKDDYILCWGNRIVFIDFNALPTTEQIATAVEKLRQ